MVTKKLQKSGNAYSIYVPIDWAKKLKGKEVKLEINSIGNLEISPVGAERKLFLKKEITLRSKDIDFIVRNVASLYIDGYDEFKIIFANRLSKNIFNKLYNLLVERGLSQYVADSSDDFILFKIPSGFLPPVDLADILMKKVLKMLMSIEQGELETAKNYRKEYISTMLDFQRLYNSALQKPYLVKEFNTSLVDLLNMLFIIYSVKEVGDWIINKRVGKKDISIVKEMIRNLLIMLSKKNFANVEKISSLKGRLSDKTLFVWIKIIERTLLNWSLI